MKTKIHIDYLRGSVEFSIYREIDGKIHLASPLDLDFKEIDEHEQIEPTFRIPSRAAGQGREDRRHS